MRTVKVRDLVMATGRFTTHAEARRVLYQGAVKVNNKIIDIDDFNEDPTITISEEELVRVQIGKRRVYHLNPWSFGK